MWQYSATPAYDDELYHHGVIGMKWGVRRQRLSDSVGSAAKSVRKVAGSASETIKSKYNSLSDKQKKGIKTAGTVSAYAGLFFTGGPLAVAGGAIAQTYVVKHPDKVAAGKEKVKELGSTITSKLKNRNNQEV